VTIARTISTGTQGGFACKRAGLLSATLAIEVYNNPAIRFRSRSYITIIVIAWTALIQAIFYF
jgi:hypothetical protein